MTTKSIGESVRRRLIDVGTRLRIPYRNIETAFLIERLVARLVADKNLATHLVFKGGFVGLKVYNSFRYTVDLDALLVRTNIDPTLVLAREKAESDLDDGVWFRFENQVNLTTQGEYGGIRQVYRSGIGEVLKDIKKTQVIHFDLGIGDPITPAPVKMEMTSVLSHIDEISWSVYPVETIIAEKLHALITHGDANSRSKDVYDLVIFLPKADARVLKEAIQRCFTFRKTDLPSSFYSILRKLDTKILARGWPSAIASVPNAPEFEKSFNMILLFFSKLEKLSLHKK